MLERSSFARGCLLGCLMALVLWWALALLVAVALAGALGLWG
jgi:hypothetical protein